MTLSSPEPCFLWYNKGEKRQEQNTRCSFSLPQIPGREIHPKCHIHQESHCWQIPTKMFSRGPLLRLGGGLLCGRAMAGASVMALVTSSGWHSLALRTLERRCHRSHSCGSMNGSLKAQRLPLEQLNWRSSVCGRLFLTGGLKKKLPATFCCCCCSHRLNFLFAFWHLVEYNRTVEPH